jgi:hypothetical protein
VIGSGVNPKIAHINYQRTAGTKTLVDQDRIDRTITREFGSDASTKALKKDDYSDDAQKEAGTNFHVTVVGIRDTIANTWDFYYQRRLSSIAQDKKGALYTQNILADRLVPIV